MKSAPIPSLHCFREIASSTCMETIPSLHTWMHLWIITYIMVMCVVISSMYNTPCSQWRPFATNKETSFDWEKSMQNGQNWWFISTVNFFPLQHNRAFMFVKLAICTAFEDFVLMTSPSRCKVYTYPGPLTLQIIPFPICNWELEELAKRHVWEQNKASKNSVGKTPAEPFSCKSPLKWEQAHTHYCEML